MCDMEELADRRVAGQFRFDGLHLEPLSPKISDQTESQMEPNETSMKIRPR